MRRLCLTLAAAAALAHPSLSARADGGRRASQPPRACRCSKTHCARPARAAASPRTAGHAAVAAAPALLPPVAATPIATPAAIQLVAGQRDAAPAAAAVQRQTQPQPTTRSAAATTQVSKPQPPAPIWHLPVRRPEPHKLDTQAVATPQGTASFQTVVSHPGAAAPATLLPASSQRDAAARLHGGVMSAAGVRTAAPSIAPSPAREPGDKAPGSSAQPGAPAFGIQIVPAFRPPSPAVAPAIVPADDQSR